ncbi:MULTISPECIES: EAL domain-containing protein [Cyanophyceae]|uniref:putative bifunctional diguanylate cyclase/phosphodiesterase n=1 Tax=Cyanophyceae TaxID=3028117 RepID=UPI0016874928|nr:MULTISPECIES: EAL domain-containing protein [Cyanophyceae]MBD1915522.1 EAL domain-containing protein [Phormidium sp. FACHB-77]MBD2031832.1 EAL domain-containing protein [Phormidium sp. FACHB-322]MBD2050582.1 EAL domain-containing protein [Leptolyngbya sp. FACHB-60]
MKFPRRWPTLLPIPNRLRAAGRSILLTSILTTILLLGLGFLGWLEPLELKVFDQFMQRRVDLAADSRLLIVGISETDLHRYGWPFSDQVLAEGLAQIQHHSPRVIGLDLYRDLPHLPGNVALKSALQAENLVAITNIIDGIAAPPEVPPDRIGFNDFTLDEDGVLRRSLLFVARDDQTYYSFALRTSLRYLATMGKAFHYDAGALWLGQVPILPLKTNDGGYQQADTNGYQTLLNYRSRYSPAPVVTWSQLMEGAIDPAQIRDRIVVIGTDAPSLKDMMYTPYSIDVATFNAPGVVVHAQIISHLLDIALQQRSAFSFWPPWGEVLWLWGWAIVGGILAWQFGHPLGLGLSSLAALGLLYASGWGLFLHTLWIPVVEPSIGFSLGLGATMAHRLFYTHSRDLLTGLLNRRAWLNALNRHLSPLAGRQHPNPPGIMVVGFDRFKQVNASLGQTTGDRLVMMMVSRLRQAIPRTAQLGRVNSDDFALALRQSDQDFLSSLANRIQQALGEPFSLNGQDIAMTASIGIVVPQPQQGYTAENLLRDAQTAMYRAQRHGQARYQVFAASMASATDQFTLETEMRHGIAHQEFVLHYQPIVELETGHIAGFEALVRWQHPRQGFVPPVRFIPLAEETGLILPLGEWICRTACRQARQWQQDFPDHPLIVSVNLSGRQFEQPHLADQLGQILQETNLDGRSLKLEITESMVMGDVETAIDLMLGLKALGCKLGMDDFGTGYSSLSYLRRFPIDTLKVDQSFIRNMGDSREDHEIVRTIIGLGHTLGMDLIAEGIETQEQGLALRSLGCEFGQGYYWAKPMPATEASAMLRATPLPPKQSLRRGVGDRSITQQPQL